MKTNHERRQQYFAMNSALSQIDNSHLYTLLQPLEVHTKWGQHQTLDIEGTTVFVKRLPVTSIEFEHMFATKNLYDLPTYYNYGFGSAGFSVWRELLANIKTTNWVLQGEIDYFPLLYHYRVIPVQEQRDPSEHRGMSPEEHANYVAYWGGHENIGQYMTDRANAEHELLLFMEYIPQMVRSLLMDNLDRMSYFLGQTIAVHDFLRKQGIIHLDAHMANMLTDGERIYLTDFGLVLDKKFPLSEDELQFFDRHTHYAYGHVISNMVFFAAEKYDALPEPDKQLIQERYGLQADSQFDQIVFTLLKHIEDIHARSLLALHQDYVDCMVQYRNVIMIMGTFYVGMEHSLQKDIQFPNEDVKQMLYEVGVAV
ncbi:MAG: hypothetical protein AAF639_42095 [Chloroflexota bacterium]